MGALKKIVRFLDGAEDAAVAVVFLLSLLVGCYGLYDSLLVLQAANDTSVLKYKPGYETATPADKPIVGTMAAWLEIPDTDVDYPVMHGKDNTEYLNKDPFGDYSLSGSIFLDSRNSPDFSDGYSVVYGHHMEGGLMFGALDRYFDGAYFDAHRDAVLIVGEEALPLRLVAVLEADAVDGTIFGAGDRSAVEVLAYARERAIHWDDAASAGEGTRLVALTTCQDPSTIDRTVVLGILGAA